MDQQKTNNELAEQFELNAKLQAQKLHEHQLDDAEQFKKIEEKMNTLATKEDIREMKEAFNDFINAIKLFKQTSRLGYKALLVVASAFIAVVAIINGLRMLTGK